MKNIRPEFGNLSVEFLIFLCVPRGFARALLPINVFVQKDSFFEPKTVLRDS